MTTDFRLRWLMRLRDFNHDEEELGSLPLRACASPFFITANVVLISLVFYVGFSSNLSEAMVPLWALVIAAVPVTLHFGYWFAIKFLDKGIVRVDNSLAWEIANDEVKDFELRKIVKSQISAGKTIDSKCIRISLPLCCSTEMYSLRELAHAAYATRVNKELDTIQRCYKDHSYPFFAILYKLENRKKYSKNKSLLELPNDVTKLLLEFCHPNDIVKIPKMFTHPGVREDIRKAYAQRFSTTDNLLKAYEAYSKKLNAVICEKANSKGHVRQNRHEDVIDDPLDLESQNISTERTLLLRNQGFG